MSKILVTGATGALGGLTVQALLHRVSADRVVALVRDGSRVAHLRDQGVEVRQGDYQDRASLLSAFQGIDALLLVSAVAFTDRLAQHVNVIEAAKAAGVRHVVYTSIQRKPGSSFNIDGVTESDIATEQALKDSGLNYTILRNGLYFEALGFLLGEDVLSKGVHVVEGEGKGALVTRGDLAEANAVVLTQAGHENAIYTLGASEAVSFREIATELSALHDEPVVYSPVSADQFVADLIDAGLPPAVAEFQAQWEMAVAHGEFAEVSGDLERLIGRKPVGYREYLRAAYGVN
ncbi:SDR family oxidoreductase [Pseudomonas sp. RC10]|uniref:SDR family oxidoreductase n=1 Tax=Pseudomonas bambusae TaxID=3139142 RepID=UPI0031397EBC